MPIWLAAIGYCFAIFVLAVIFVLTAPVSWLALTLGGAGLTIAEFCATRIRALWAKVVRGG